MLYVEAELLGVRKHYEQKQDESRRRAESEQAQLESSIGAF